MNISPWTYTGERHITAMTLSCQHFIMIGQGTLKSWELPIWIMLWSTIPFAMAKHIHSKFADNTFSSSELHWTSFHFKNGHITMCLYNVHQTFAAHVFDFNQVGISHKLKHAPRLRSYAISILKMGLILRYKRHSVSDCMHVIMYINSFAEEIIIQTVSKYDCYPWHNFTFQKWDCNFVLHIQYQWPLWLHM